MEISSNHDHDLNRSTSTSNRWSYNFTASIRLTAAVAAAVSDSLGGSRSGGAASEEEELRWAAIERLPTYERVRKSVLTQILDNGQVKSTEVDVKKLDEDVKNLLKDRIIKVIEEDNERLLQRFRDRIDRVGIDIPKIEIRYENLRVEGDVYSGSRALPSLFNVALNTFEGIISLVRLLPSKKRKIQILKDISGIVKPSRMTLLLGPPGAGKTTLLLSLADKLDRNLRKSGRITYCGHEFNEFVPQRTCAYISQHDLHHGEMTVRETLDFSGRCLGIGTRYDLLAELSRREKTSGIKPDPEIDAFMKAVSIPGQNSSLVTDYVLKLLGLDICADILVGDNMRRGISGGQKKRLTTGEMLVGPAKVLLMDEISTGLDSSTTYQIMRYMRQIVHILDVTMIVALLQPAPETYDLFDDIILLSEGHIVYQGSRESVLVFFKQMGFKCPERKAVADFLQEVTSKKDQEQYWCNKNRPYRYMSAKDFSDAFKSFYLGRNLTQELGIPYDKSRTHPAALVKHKYGISNWDLLRACFSREWLLMRRSSFLYIFKTTQLTIMAIVCFSIYFRTEMPHGLLGDGRKYYGALFFSLTNVMFNGLAEVAVMIFRLPVFYKQRDHLFFPAWAFALPIWFLRIPISFLESAVWCALTYYTIGFAPSAARFFKQFLAFFWVHNMSLGLFRFIAALARTQVLAFTLATFMLLVIFVLGGFVIAKNDLQSWIKWAYYTSPMSYGQNAIAVNEFLAQRWASPNTDLRFDQPTVGKVLLSSRGFNIEEKWFWICISVLVAFSIFFNLLCIASLTFLNPIDDSNNQTLDEDDDTTERNKKNMTGACIDAVSRMPQRGMILPFEPLSLAFDHINYYVDMPAEMKAKGFEGDRLQLLRDVSGVFRPRVLTALVGVSGAGKTTLMDVLAGRKTGGYVEGEIKISGYPKNQSTFARISGYCEQNDIHSPYVTVYESVLYSAWLRLSGEVDEETRKMFVEQVMLLVELNPLRNSLVGLPGVNGLSTEQRKRLTIAVELVANPSIIFMDEPTSGLDARAAAIVMRTVRNTVDTGRTVVCTIHQPSIDIFETFDELLLMKRGGRAIYTGPLGHHSHKLIEYFESISGVPKITEGYNPATWMLDITTPAIENQLGVDFADIYANSPLYRSNQELIRELSVPTPDSKDLYFPTKYSQPFLNQCKACFWKQYWSYWRNTEYNAVRFLTAIIVGVIFGVIYWNKGQKTSKEQDLQNLLGAIYSAVIFLGAANINPVQGVVAIERTVFYRERAAGMYSALAYAFAQVLIEVIYIAIQAIIYTLILYSMIGFEWTVGKFFLFYYLIFASFVYFVMYGMMLVSLSPSVEISSIVGSFFLSFWNLFSGFLIPRTQIPIWWRWYYWCSPTAWTLYGIIASQLGDLTSQVAVPGNGFMTVKVYLDQNLGFKHSFLPLVCVMHVVFIVLFCAIFAFAIKCINFQRR